MPQPIDINTELGRLTAAERIQQVADRASLAAQQRVHSDILEQETQNETVVQQTEEGAEKQPVDAEAGGQNPAAGRQRKQGKGSEDARSEQAPKARDDEEHRFDVTI